MKKATGVGSVARINPPSTPPMIRATFMCRKLRAVALDTAAGGTRSLTIAIVAGEPIVSAMPSRTASTRITLRSGAAPRATDPNRTATMPRAMKFAISIVRAPSRSVRTPACGMSSRTGRPTTENTRPTAAAEPVTWSTYQPSAALNRKSPLVEHSIAAMK